MLGALFTCAILNSRLDDLLKDPALDNSMVGACVLDADGEILFDFNAHQRMIPASNQKVFTCAYAMATLGPETRIKTRFWKIADGVIVDAPGDPTVTSAQLKEVRRQLGLKAGGDVYVRQAYSPGVPASWEWDDLPFRYAPVINAFTSDSAAFEVYASDGKVEPLPKELKVKLKRNRTTGSRATAFNRWTATLTIEGGLPKGRTLMARYAQPAPAESAAAWLGGNLRPWNGDAPTRTPDYTLESAPVSQLIKDCLEPSDNLLAEHLLLMSASQEGSLGEEAYSTATERLHKFLVESVGLEDGWTRASDGCGLSRHNMTTPYALLRTLHWANQQPFASLFRSALAAPGEGTLSSRLKGVPFTGKTGTIFAVSSLSGILNPDSDKTTKYICLMFNQADKSNSVLRSIQDRFVLECLRQDPVHEAAGHQAPLQNVFAHADAGLADAYRLY